MTFQKDGQLVGKTIAHYKISKKLGEGGMGEVYLAEDTKLKRKVAIKLLPSHLTKDKQSRERFEREAQAAAALNHPNIVTVYEIGEFEDTVTADKQIYISMEYVEGKTLGELLIENGQLSIDNCVNIATQICEGLEKAHQAGIVHRDIKPANILIDKGNRVKILDFGLAKLKSVSKLTKETTTLGTVQYMSPEQVRGDEVDHRTDIWSFGVLFYEMLTGQLPFRGEYEQAVLYSILNEEPEPIENRQTKISEELNQLVKKLLKKDKNERYRNSTEILNDLNSIKSKLKTQESKIENSKQTLSIAVLPFVNMSSDPENEYFSDGLSEELINALCKIEALRVVARTSAFSFKGKEMDVRDIGKKLNVEQVLEGSVRKASDQLRITAQLINVANGYHIWSEKYDRKLDDVFAIQDDIAFQITENLKSKLVKVSQEEQEKYTANLEAYEWYLKGRYHWNKFSAKHLQKTIQCYMKAIENDPNYAIAYAALAEVYIFQATAFSSSPCSEAMPKAKTAAERALHLNQNLPEAQAALGMIATFFDWNSDKAKTYLRRAIEINPNYASGYLWLEFPLSLLDQNFDEAIDLLNRGLELDPLNLLVKLRLGYLYYYKYDFDRAIEEFQKILDIEPNLAAGHHGLMDAYGQKGMYKQAIFEGEKTLAIAGHAIAHIGVMGYYYGRGGKEKEARTFLAELLDRSNREIVSPFWIATIYVGLNEKDHAFNWFTKGLEQKDGNLLYTMAPPFDPIRTDPRFIELRKKMGLDK